MYEPFHARKPEKTPVKKTPIVVAVLVAIMAAVVAAVLTLGASGPVPPVPPQPVHVSDRICPVSDCTGYPDPSHVRGITIAALQNYLLPSDNVLKQIDAASSWNANTVRLQVAQDRLVGANGNRINTAYMAAVEKIVNYSLSKGLYVVINATTEINIGFVANENLPTPATYAFWQAMTGKYGSNKRVIFDLFNEPRNSSWAEWETAFQPLTWFVHDLGARNQIWVEGNDWGSTYAGIPHLIHANGVVYSFHHPGAPWAQGSAQSAYNVPHNAAPQNQHTWYNAFGFLAKAGVPVVEGEFVNYLGGYYWAPNGTRKIHDFFSYLTEHGVGMVSWSLQPGVMTKGNDLTVPVHMPQGAGQLIWNYYHGDS